MSATGQVLELSTKFKIKTETFHWPVVPSYVKCWAHKIGAVVFWLRNRNMLH